jgi:hypothetical protein
MTKEQYLDMCEALGSEPIEEEIPVEFSDLPLDIQETYCIYAMMQDIWEPMSGSYIGKNYSGLSDILDIMEVDDKRTMLFLIEAIDRFRKKSIAAQRANNETPPA